MSTQSPKVSKNIADMCPRCDARLYNSVCLCSRDCGDPDCGYDSQGRPKTGRN